MRLDFAFIIGDYVAGTLIGVLTACAVHLFVRPTMDTVLAMLLGMGLGMAVHLVAGLSFAPLLGAFHTMVPGSLIGMYGGMLFAMRETMQHPTSLNHAARIGALFGILVVASMQLYDLALRVGRVQRNRQWILFANQNGNGSAALMIGPPGPMHAVLGQLNGTCSQECKGAA